MNANLLDSPALGRSRWDPRLACAVTLVLVFVTGGVLGALAMDLVVHNRGRAVASFDTPSGKALYFDRMRRDLDLTPAQTEQMESILDDLWHDYRSVLNDSKVRVEQVLNEQQRLKFEHILQESSAGH